MKFEVDHIDPQWDKSRDYQLVCGLDSFLNLKEREPGLNKSKNNRFLPWRKTQGELGETPVDPGDWCLFLDPDTGEWVLEEFMGSWWYEKTKSTLSSSVGANRYWSSLSQEEWESRTEHTRRNRGPRSDKTKQKLRLANLGKKQSEETLEKKRKARLLYEARKKVSRMSVNDPLCPDFD